MSALRAFQEKSVIARPPEKSSIAGDEYEEDDDIYGSGQTAPDRCSSLKPLGCPYGKFKVKKKYALMYGHILEKRKAFITIGIPTIKRIKANYIEATITKLIRHLTPDDYPEVVIVVFLADFDPEIRSERAESLSHTFSKYIEMGLLQIIQSPRSFYPNAFLYNSKENEGGSFNKSKKLTRWHQKQSLDYSYLMAYCSHLSAKYYLQLDDDVDTAPHYLAAIKDFINQQARSWVSLDFCELGSIGKLYLVSEINLIAKFAYFMYREQPIDALFRFYNSINMQIESRLRTPSVFQHVGYYSSNNKTQDVKDKYFEIIETEREYRGDNPPAIVTSTMKVFKQHTPELCYGKSPGYFWAANPQKGDTLLIKFHVEHRIKRLVVATGMDKSKKDILPSAEIRVSGTAAQKVNGEYVCHKNFVTVTSEFIDGVADCNDLDRPLDFPVKCIKVIISENQNSWIIFREIAVFLSRNH
ncbi:uncharacterized protein TRIADDRAFT_55928 [Trichoplax adhaerens]|uniref:Alpha-1,3-mannosyl-glycoprotein 4-beta-N-acetylglucosaminyltransferase C n=1 Tax=Trichoplax adhaerens TaxID=10228 RepID=B3RTH6_TRIAD|nr:hypothetical protein TRIADDRAFT_55928 [Trichoplax adhaerens]EDV25630.1 hypothetical protein TRIADDRAFT_55928 [Trichoplax adhaerens]|eukprot:XP_002111663.1 hypothetical protein TRIADDRAFT_55928 [Trichoplax adhaerens]